MTRRPANAQPQEVEADLDLLHALAGRIVETQTHLDHLYEQRRDAYHRLLSRGFDSDCDACVQRKPLACTKHSVVSQAAVGRAAQVSSMAVAIAVGKAPATSNRGASPGSM